MLGWLSFCKDPFKDKFWSSCLYSRSKMCQVVVFVHDWPETWRDKWIEHVKIICSVYIFYFAITWVDYAAVNSHSCWQVSGYRHLLCEDVSHTLWWQRAISILWTPGRSLPLFTHMHCWVLNNMHKPSIALIYYLKILSVYFLWYSLYNAKLVFALPQMPSSNIVCYILCTFWTLWDYVFFLHYTNVGKITLLINS